MIGLIRWLLGYVKFRFSKGFYEGFLGECFNHNLKIRDISLCDDGFTAYCNINCYKRLRPLAKKHGGCVRVVKKYGLPFHLKPLKNRFGLAVGAVLFVFFISFLGGFVWNIEIVGNDRLSTAQISAYLENNGLKTGVMWSSFDKSVLALEMMRDFDDAAWVHINKIGTTARVEINETIEQPQPDMASLRGERVFRKELETTASRTQSKIRVKGSKNYYTLHFYMINLPLYIRKSSSDFESTSEHLLSIKDKQLPIGYTLTSERWLSGEEYELSDEELIALAQKKLALLEQSELDGFEIVNKSQKNEMTDDSCTIKGSYIVRVKG